MDSAELNPGVKPRFASRGSGHFDLLLAAFCIVIVLSNIVAVKPIGVGSASFGWGWLQVWPLVLDGGAILFPLAYVLGDVISEVYGFAAMRRVVFTGFAMSVLAFVTFWLVIWAPPAAWWPNQAAFESILGPVVQIVAASLAGYVTGQLLNAKVLVSMKRRRHENALVSRLVASTGVGELADTIIFCTIAAPVIGIGSFDVFLNYVIVGVLFKVGIEILLLPVTVRVINLVKRAEPGYWN